MVALANYSNDINFNFVPIHGDDWGLPIQCFSHPIPTRAEVRGVAMAMHDIDPKPWSQPHVLCLNQPMAPSQDDKGISSWQRQGIQQAGVPRSLYLTCQPQLCQPHSALPKPHVADVLLIDSRRGEGQRGRPSNTGPTSCVQVAHDSGRWRPSRPRRVTHGPNPLT